MRNVRTLRSMRVAARHRADAGARPRTTTGTCHAPPVGNPSTVRCPWGAARPHTLPQVTPPNAPSQDADAHPIINPRVCQGGENRGFATHFPLRYDHPGNPQLSLAFSIPPEHMFHRAFPRDVAYQPTGFSHNEKENARKPRMRHVSFSTGNRGRRPCHLRNLRNITVSTIWESCDVVLTRPHVCIGYLSRLSPSALRLL